MLFIIPWDEYWVIGTTDTPWTQDPRDVGATSDDIDYVLEHANAVLKDHLTREDVIGVYSGLRPLLQPVKKGSDKGSTKVSREHTVMQVEPGLSAIAGGKYTTYRVMAKDAVDAVSHGLDGKVPPSCTDTVPPAAAKSPTAGGTSPATSHASASAVAGTASSGPPVSSSLPASGVRHASTAARR